MNEKFISILTEIKPEILDASECDLIGDGIIDSLDVMTIISKCEDEFEVDFDPMDIVPENFASPETIWALIEKYWAE